MKTIKIIGIWIIGLMITLGAAKYQRSTGPTYPYSETISINGKQYEIELIRSGSTSSDAEILLPIGDQSVSAILKYRRFPTNEEFTSINFKHDDSKLIALLPSQPMAGKLQYEVEIATSDESIILPMQVIRFKGDVPAYILIPHILFMFICMFLSNVSGIMAAFNHQKFAAIGYYTFICLLIGGMILGPIVQKFAFDEFWAGVPFGWDLTDNKTLIAFVFWIIAVIANRKHPSRTWTIVASLATLVIFAIPHSMFGSELNPDTGEIIQATIFLNGLF